jgi:broad specificity phosphatase PhoE
MLFVISRGHDDYSGGQDNILHLISDVDTVRLSNQHCFFTDIHADLDYAEQVDDFSRINELDLNKIINERYWQDFKEEKQAEFLAFEAVQWQTIQRIGVKSQEVAERVRDLIQRQAHQPDIVVKPDWYY